MKPILLALVSPHGSTAKIADHLKSALEAAGHRVEIEGLSAPLDLSRFSSVVVAAPINGMNWLPPAQAFLNDHAADLRERPLAMVALSYLYFEGRPAWKRVILRNLETLRRPFPHASVQVFGGRLPSALPAPARWLFGVAKGRPLDLINPKLVMDWASEWVKSVR